MQIKDEKVQEGTKGNNVQPISPCDTGTAAMRADFFLSIWYFLLYFCIFLSETVFGSAKMIMYSYRYLATHCI